MEGKEENEGEKEKKGGRGKEKKGGRKGGEEQEKR
jgi:hypothetical protein